MSVITVDESLFNAISTPAEALNIVGLNTLAEECVYMLPGCGDLMLRKMLQQVFRDFCQRTGTLITRDTGIVTHEADTLALCKDNGEFQVFYGARIAASGEELKNCRINDCMLIEECGDMSVEFSLPQDEDDEDGDPVEYDVDVTYSYVPRIGTEVAPLWYLNKYGDAIVAGTLFRLLSMPNKPWSDPTTGQLKAIEYQNALNNAVINRLTGGNYADLNCRSSVPFI